MRFKGISVILSVILLTGCAHQKDDFKDRSPESIYAKALGYLKNKDYTDAAEEFKDIEKLFPYSSKANEGQVLAAYSYFLASSYTDALREIEIFLRYHPAHAMVPYVLYLKAMCLYMQTVSVGRDSRNALDARMAFFELLNRFPDSPYSADSFKRIKLLNDIIAAHDMSIGYYYQKNKSPLSAIKRYTFVITNFPNTKHAEEAYFRIIECCNSIGLIKDAQNSYEVMKAACPESSWTQKAANLMPK